MTTSLRRLFLISLLFAVYGASPPPFAWSPTAWITAATPPILLPPGPGRVLGIPQQSPVITEKARASGLPTFSRNIILGDKRYTFTLVGRDVFAPRAKNVTITLQIIPISFTFPDGSVFDPTAPGPACSGGGIPLELTLQSPLFQNYNYGDGGRQFYETVRRLEFWPYTGGGRVNPGYSVRLAPVVFNTLQITLPAGYKTVSAPCGRIGMIDYPSLDVFLKTQIFPQFARAGITPQTFPLFLFSNVIVSNGGSLLGYHSSFSTAKGIQTYGVAEYDTNRADPNTADISVLSHEIAEWYDDPFVNNFVPPWGHIGQVSDCYPLLEVGDPLSWTPPFEIEMPNGFVYHPKETAYFSWFFGQVPGYGANGYYSSGGSFTSPADPCQ
jgi:hypothetical protein